MLSPSFGSTIWQVVKLLMCWIIIAVDGQPQPSPSVVDRQVVPGLACGFVAAQDNTSHAPHSGGFTYYDEFPLDWTGIRDRLLALFIAIAPVNTLPGSTSTARSTASSGRVLAGRLPVGTIRAHCSSSRQCGASRRLIIQGRFFVLESATPRAPLANRTPCWIFPSVSGMLPNLIWLLPLCGHWRDNFVMELDRKLRVHGSPGPSQNPLAVSGGLGWSHAVGRHSGQTYPLSVAQPGAHSGAGDDRRFLSGSIAHHRSLRVWVANISHVVIRRVGHEHHALTSY